MRLAMPSNSPAVRRGAAPRRDSAHGGSQIVFNYLPVQYRPGRFSAGVMPYEAAEQLRRLRDDLAGTHVVIRSGDTIVCVPVVPDAPTIGSEQEFNTEADSVVVTSLLQAALRRVLTEGWNFRLRKFAPLVFVSRIPGRDLLEAAASGTNVEGLHVYPEYRLDVRRRGPAGTPGILVGIKARYEIDLPVSELLRRGVRVEGRYVLAVDHDVPVQPNTDLSARRRLVGMVEVVVGDRLRLTDSSGQSEIPASEAWLEPRRDVFHDMLAIAAGSGYRRIESRLNEAAFKLSGAEGRYERTKEIADGLGRHSPLTIAVGVQASIGEPAGSTSRISTRRLDSPTFVFDLSGDKTHRYPRQGLERYGPFDSEMFTPKTPSVAVVTPQQFKGSAEEFMHAFLHGVPGKEAFSQGFIRKYRLTDCKVTFTVFDGGAQDAGAYRQACLTALEAIKPDLAIVLVSQEQEHLYGDASPYMVSKSTFMSQGVPVQEVQVETIRDADRASTLSTIALACYAKLGGTPFVIGTSHRAMAHELVIGIGRSDVQTSRLGGSQRFVGITTVFSSDGNYMLSNASKQAPYEQYPQELLRTLRTCIQDVMARHAWQPDDTIRLIFHVFKPLKDRETRAVKELVEELTKDYAGVDFAFLHVGNDHDWMMFDLRSAGTRRRGQVTGRAVPARGHAVQVSRSEMLISVTEPADMKLPLQGAPRPLKIKLHKGSTFTDLDYLAGQVFRFTALSWRRFYPASQPVTILYSELIAGLLGQLRDVTNWNPDMISAMPLRWSRWFL
ncbi:argonaute/piwi family protein [Streptomyces flavalbus]|uniref:Protein argonaute n=1 Tax=Streptomyces flavalbus TaxID=2665155 RepID=A0ABW2W8B7_9ACTN